MKFSQLPIGARFEYEGKVYVKTGPIAATSESGGQRMIPRYAVLRPLDDAVPMVLPKPSHKVDEAEMLAAFEVFALECDQVLAEAVQDAARLESARRRLAEAQERFRAKVVPVDREGPWLSAQEE